MLEPHAVSRKLINRKRKAYTAAMKEVRRLAETLSRLETIAADLQREHSEAHSTEASIKAADCEAAINTYLCRGINPVIDLVKQFATLPEQFD